MTHSRALSRLLLVVAALPLVLAACGGGTKSPAASQVKGAGPAQPQSARNEITADACSLLTVAEMTAVIGRTVEPGGMGTNAPGSCTYSVGGDIGAGVVGIRIDDAMTCTAVRRALTSGLAGTDSVRVDIGDGGFVAGAGGHIDFAVPKGCLSISASIHGRSLAKDAMLTLARAAATRV